jgi:hypothetical protein
MGFCLFGFRTQGSALLYPGLYSVTPCGAVLDDKSLSSSILFVVNECSTDGMAVTSPVPRAAL